MELRRVPQSSFLLRIKGVNLLEDLGIILHDPDDEGPSSKSQLVPATLRPAPTPTEKPQKQIGTANRKFRTFGELYHWHERLQYVIEGVLPRTGVMYFGGTSGGGKTILAIQFVVDMVLGRNTMTWKMGKDLPQIRIMILSLEMPSAEFHERIRIMYPILTDVEFKILEENIIIYSEGRGFNLWEDQDIAEIAVVAFRNNITGIMIDSASVSFAEGPNEAKQINKTIQNLYEMRAELNLFNIVVAHTRKPQTGSNAPDPAEVTHGELTGHSGLAQSASSVLILIEDQKLTSKDPDNKVVHCTDAKDRFGSGGEKTFKILLPKKHRTEAGVPLQFTRNAIPLPPATEEMKARAKALPPAPLSSSFAGIDFKALAEEE